MECMDFATSSSPDTKKRLPMTMQALQKISTTGTDENKNENKNKNYKNKSKKKGIVANIIHKFIKNHTTCNEYYYFVSILLLSTQHVRTYDH